MALGIQNAPTLAESGWQNGRRDCAKTGPQRGKENTSLLTKVQPQNGMSQSYLNNQDVALFAESHPLGNTLPSTTRIRVVLVKMLAGNVCADFSVMCAISVLAILRNLSRWLQASLPIPALGWSVPCSI
jgi:hypothetical protein